MKTPTKRSTSKPTPIHFDRKTLASRSPAEQVLAIDVHAHYGDYKINPGEAHAKRVEFYTGDARTVAKRAAEARTEWTVVSPLLGLMPAGHYYVVAGNDEATRTVRQVPGLLQWVVIDPTEPESFDQARVSLLDPWCVGIKIHPELHQYPILRHGRAIFEFAAEHKAVVLAHSGDRFSMPGDYVEFANDFPDMRVIVAHLGHGCDGNPTHQVAAIQASRHGNIFTDTSSANSILPKLVEWAIGEVGPDRILYGTDTPLYAASMQRARIDLADITDAQKRKILRENAVKLLGLERRFTAFAAKK